MSTLNFLADLITPSTQLGIYVILVPQGGSPAAHVVPFSVLSPRVHTDILGFVRICLGHRSQTLVIPSGIWSPVTTPSYSRIALEVVHRDLRLISLAE
jgi:hypothetical protein